MTPETLIKRAGTLHRALAESHPSLSRGKVWCRACGREQSVDAAHCFGHGWPKCCGATMTIDSPEERAALAAGNGGK